MADANALANVGLTLIEILREGMPEEVDPADVKLMSPADREESSSVRLTLHLYAVEGSGHLRNANPPPRHDRDRVPASDPLRLDLRYLLTAYPSDATDETRNTRDQHRVLGHAMRVLREHAVVPGVKLDGTFSDDEGVQISILPEARDEAMNMWGTFGDQPYRPSVAYLVTPVRIDPVREEEVERVVDRTIVEHVSEGDDE
ncbi:DUF4255 domain-containing protein [Natrialbaceae archaeon AArc-T1-2]|uniref:DUF4255 domain-containing protein n=1 Tax=Natrialbaceae archaeon AArc-T1-2 TaxID=3053904 RepID=UPI00255B2307|nr:DUF4255 domain-containing protein [Natrialbaceae archaeon AArc-T1-2]WIV66078.1 DUF4255 domain-containing protein [Natrialbaceae archaeon AArc-T1-2]